MGGSQKIHKMSFEISEDGTYIIGSFNNGLNWETWYPVKIIDNNTLRMYGEDATMDFVWGHNSWGIECVSVSATGSMPSGLLNEYIGRSLQ